MGHVITTHFAKHATHRGKNYDIYFVIEDMDNPGTVILFRYGCQNKRPPTKHKLVDQPLTRLAFTTNLDYTRELYVIAESGNPSSRIAFKV